MNIRAITFLLTAVSACLVGSGLSSAADARVTFEKDIRPIFKAYCFHCHGEEKELSGSLDVRLRRLIIRGGDSGEAIVPGKHAESLLYQYVESGDMPPDEKLRLKPEEVALIAKWIDQGAKTEGPEPEGEVKPGDFLITSDERSHWAFRPIKKAVLPELPELKKESGKQAVNPVDAFIARKLKQNGLWFSEEADRLTLIRRAAFDLTGLPPAPEDVEAYLADQSPDAYEKMIDRLLASPHYGERWARHWLDVAGYADSEGYNDKDIIRPDAWHYRDYVIKALNADKPWDEFITEQLAGDELVKATHATAQKLVDQDPAVCEKLTATGFLRLAPDGTGSSPMDPAVARNQVITETVKIMSSSLLGMTVGCAECHHHRFDPIPQEDFYRLRAVIAPVYDDQKWRMPASRRAALMSVEDKAKAAKLSAQVKELDAEHNKVKAEVTQLIAERVLKEVPEADREQARAAYETAVKERSKEQADFLKQKYPMLDLLVPGRLHLFLARFKDGNDLKKRYEDIKEKADKLRAEIPQPEYIRVATEDTQHLPQTFVFYRGDFSSPEKDLIAPGGLTVIASKTENTFELNDPKLPTTGRRLAYARYLTSGKHPLVARVLMNRFWMHHFGQAIVDSTGDFGSRSSIPTHPELLDWLAADFMEQGWQLKRIHRLIMTSRTYKQTSAGHSEKAAAIDADNRLFWRMTMRRLEAESIRDAILAVSGELNREQFGAPVPVSLADSGIITVGAGKVSKDRRELKRSIYVQVRRTQPVTMLSAFDAPSMEPNCERRVFSTVATQSLALLNSEFMRQQSEAFAKRVLKAAGKDADDLQLIKTAWKLALSSEPSAAELKALQTNYAMQLNEYQAKKVKEPRQEALAAVCHVLFGTNQFLYVE
ncbi:PSD1 and planctomycete cytochrome C domain-containing protein [Gimesia panareensis]|uniref:PSD1 and planctomycete cytochrome C domain-containing protein n=1 Tax=Gimesia panareensis TaxID=2527978 RepID=UPI00118BFDF5|nr:PSD1 and planctomycete cytochrome C domain-containing protein [Gimesia panareensis]QDU50385.1 Planctomycete cytochrome C [Gimesia panareensis]